MEDFRPRYLKNEDFSDQDRNSTQSILWDISFLIESLVDHVFKLSHDNYQVTVQKGKGPRFVFSISVLIYEQRCSVPCSALCSFSKSEIDHENTEAVENFYKDRDRIGAEFEHLIIPRIEKSYLLDARIDPREYQIEGIEVSQLEPYIRTAFDGVNLQNRKHGGFELFADFDIIVQILDIRGSMSSEKEYLAYRFEYLCRTRNANIEELEEWAEDIGVVDVHQIRSDRLCELIGQHYGF